MQGEVGKGKQAGSSVQCLGGIWITKPFLSHGQKAEERRQFEWKQKNNLEG